MVQDRLQSYYDDENVRRGYDAPNDGTGEPHYPCSSCSGSESSNLTPKDWCKILNMVNKTVMKGTNRRQRRGLEYLGDMVISRNLKRLHYSKKGTSGLQRLSRTNRSVKIAGRYLEKRLALVPTKFYTRLHLKLSANSTS
jgi:hypothetical protein